MVHQVDRVWRPLPGLKPGTDSPKYHWDTLVVSVVSAVGESKTLALKKTENLSGTGPAIDADVHQAPFGT